MKAALASLFDRIRGATASGDPEIVKIACELPEAKPSASKAQPITLAYPIGVKDIGHRLSSIAVQHATGRPTVWARSLADEHLLTGGSILHQATPLSHLWGTGLDPAEPIGEPQGERIWALRGKRTYELLNPEIGGLRDVPLGDPLFLVGRAVAALGRSPNPNRYRLGLVLKGADRNHPAIAHLCEQEDVLSLDVRHPPAIFFTRMANCQAIASATLPGLILAEAMGIPNLWFDLEEEQPSFEFEDWFSLADAPQAAPVHLGAKPQANELAGIAALHDIRIDEPALRSALPRAVLEELSVAPNKAPRIVHTLSCRLKPLPIFLPCHDLGAQLEHVAAGYRRQTIPHELVLIDGGNGGLETQQAIEALQQDGAQVRVIDPGTPEQQTRSLQHVIQQYFKRWGEPQRYAIASGAVDFSNSSPDALALYDELLDCFPEIEAVGPMLRIQDLPFGHPALSAEIAEHWLHERSLCETSFGPVGAVQTSLAGNFALCRADGRHRPPRSGLRVHHPYDARNLAWTVVEQERPARRLYW